MMQTLKATIPLALTFISFAFFGIVPPIEAAEEAHVADAHPEPPVLVGEQHGGPPAEDLDDSIHRGAEWGVTGRARPRSACKRKWNIRTATMRPAKNPNSQE